MVGVWVMVGDSFQLLKSPMPTPIVGVVTDPPYGIAFMGSEWDRQGSGLAYEDWCFEWIRLSLPHLSGGGVIGSFTAARQVHRLERAMRRAGLVEIRRIAWAYLSGYPKFLDLGKLSEEDVTDRLSQYRHTALKPAWEPFLIGRYRPVPGCV